MIKISLVISVVLIACLVVCTSTQAHARRSPPRKSLDKLINAIVDSYFEDDSSEMSDSMLLPAHVAADWAKEQVGRCVSPIKGKTVNGKPCFTPFSFIYEAYKTAGKTIPKDETNGEYEGAGIHVVHGVGINHDIGDILWSRGGRVGIYVGGGQVVSAENEYIGVKMRSASNYFLSKGIELVFRAD